MDMIVNDVVNLMEQIAPPYLQEEWDNSGFLVGDKSAKVNGIMVALDVTENVIAQVKNAGVNMIVSHHPVIFRPIKEITDSKNTLVYELVKNDMNVYCAHTTLDNARGGVNDCLAEKLNLSETYLLDEMTDGQGTGRIGKLNKTMNAKKLAQYTKNALGCEYIRYADAGNDISKVAIVGGSGASFIDKAIESGVDALITGDIKHHDVLDCLEQGLTIVDATHFATEQLVKDRIINHLQSAVNKLQYNIVLLKADEKDNMRILVRE